MDKTACPVCRQELTTSLLPNSKQPDFRLCSNCGIAVRLPGTIPATRGRLEIYNEKWALTHNHNPIAQDVAKSLSAIAGKTLGSQSGAKILDIGCGSGVLVDRLSRIGYEAFGIDWSEPAIQFAKQHMKGLFLVANVEDLNPQDLGFQFDMITASHILEHLVDPHSFLRLVARLLKPQGCLVIAVPNLNWYDPESAWRSVSTVFDGEHVIGYSPLGLQKVLTQSRFDVVEVTTKTHTTTILTAVGVSVYRRLRKVQGSSSSSDNRQGAIQQAYGGIMDNPIVAAVLSGVLAPFNRMSERNLRGMELIAAARKAE